MNPREGLQNLYHAIAGTGERGHEDMTASFIDFLEFVIFALNLLLLA